MDNRDTEILKETARRLGADINTIIKPKQEEEEEKE